MDEFVLFAFLLFTANKSNSSVCFLGEPTARQSAFRNYLTFRLSNRGTKKENPKLCSSDLIVGNEVINHFSDELCINGQAIKGKAIMSACSAPSPHLFSQSQPIVKDGNKITVVAKK